MDTDAENLYVNLFDAAGEVPLTNRNPIKWPTGATLPMRGETMRVRGMDDLQVVRRVFHVDTGLGLVVDLFCGYVAGD